MSIKRYLILMGIASLICWLSLVTVVYCIDPTATTNVGYFCFYASLFFSLLGTFSLIGLIIRLAIKRHEIPFRNIGISLRQGLWFSIFITMSLAILGQKLFSWWSIGLLLLCLIILETFFLSRRHI
jgi:hypothetical protein